MTQEHWETLARYNRWMNEKIYSTSQNGYARTNGVFHPAGKPPVLAGTRPTKSVSDQRA
jgi:hypothetical protein